MKFLETIAHHIIEENNDKLDDVAIILPNKRAKLYLQKYFSQQISQPVWLPDIKDLAALIEEWSDLTILDDTLLLFELYLCYKNNVENPESFDEFLKWGKVLLHDFIEIDRYLIDTKELFHYINEARAIDVWNLGEELTENQQLYIKFWNNLEVIYHAFKNHLLANNIAHQGLALRELVEDINTLSQKKLPKKIYFIGFNALTTAEKKLIKYLIEQHQATIIFDGDAHYVEDENQEAGLFIRRYKKQQLFPIPAFKNHFQDTPKAINIYGLASKIAEVKFAADILSGFNKDDLNDTAVVLSDEKLLVPFLNSLPNNVKTVNVTMGIPLRDVTLATFFDAIFLMYINAQRFESKNSFTYHLNDIRKVLNDLLIKNEDLNQQINTAFTEKNKVYLKADELITTLNHPIIEILFADNLTTTGFIEIVLELIHYIKQQPISKIDREFLFHFNKLFLQLSTLLSKNQLVETLKGLYKLYKQLLNQLKIDLYGEPLQGLQIMGVLETRNLDFKNLIILSVNEGILPSGKSFNSFIPFEAQKYFNIPTHIEKDAVYAYHFYRLLQRSENTNLLYNNNAEEFGGGEKSRFITQLTVEFKPYTNIKINEKFVNQSFVKQETNEVSIIKTEQDEKELISYLTQKGLSPSALNTFINCPLDFYYKYILKVKEEEELEEVMENSTFGIIVHETLETLYTPLINKYLVKEDIQQLISDYPDILEQKFLAYFPKRMLHKGENSLYFNVAKHFIEKFLNQEKKLVQKHKVRIIALEKDDLKTTIDINGINIILNGKIDRIDEIDNQIRIIDYKTGGVETNDLKIKIDDVLELDIQNHIARQLLVYGFIYKNNNPSKLFKTGVFSFKKFSLDYQFLRLEDNDIFNEEMFAFAKKYLTKQLSNLIETTAFSHKIDAKYCAYCQ